MSGVLLRPLSELRKSDSKLSQKYEKKYEGREEVTQRKIELLDCLWNEIVQFLPLHPRKVFELQVELGLIPKVPQYKYYETNVGLLDPNETAVFFKTAPGEENITIKWLADVDFDSIQNIPEATINYYKTLAGTGELPFNYQFIPHILHKGRVDISESKIISL